MRYIADLHIHSPYSRATSKASTLAGLAAWARVKGIHLVATGDCTHPAWFAQLKNQLVPAEPGLFQLKDDQAPAAVPGLEPEPIPVRFILSVEISSIYKRGGRVRKVHNLIYLPDFASAERLNATLAGIGNIESDGRPILGLDSRDLLEIVLEQAPEGFLVPAHIWTPWFSLFGSKSGFDAIEECFGDLSDQVFALETGLSSDPDMNRLVSALDRFTLISNSDCHSPAKLGREANVFETGFDFFSMREALKKPATGLAATIEFYPEEGKYHCDGHRKCRVCLEPRQTRELAGICPVCGRPVTVGVLHRVLELADRDSPRYPEGAPGVHSLVPLPELLGEILDCGPATKRVLTQYARVIAAAGSEFNLYLKTPIEEINRLSPVLGEAIRRIRANRVIRQPGYDGAFGTIQVFEPRELEELAGQIRLFAGPGRKKKAVAARLPLNPAPPTVATPAEAGPRTGQNVNQEQQQAILSPAQRILVAAGPGTGKTHTLVARLTRLLVEKIVPAGKLVAITFTNRAADEIRERLAAKVEPHLAEQVFIGTFHRFCLEWLRRLTPELMVVGDEERQRLLARLLPELSRDQRQQFREWLGSFFQAPAAAGRRPPPEWAGPLSTYLAALEARQALDLDQVIPAFVQRFQEDRPFRQQVRDRVTALLVDEFQDLNACQDELVRLLADSAQLFAIGDPDQAIYGFRGSDLSFFHRLAEEDDTLVLTLSKNYRSAPRILEAATAMIRHNGPGPGRNLQPMCTLTGRMELHQPPTPQAEAELVVRRIEELMGGISHFSLASGRGGESDAARSFGDFAVLVRLGQQAAPITEALARRGIPCQQVGATPYYRRPPLRALYYWLRTAAGQALPAEQLGVLRAVAGIGETTIQRLEQALEPVGADFLASAPSMPLTAATVDRLNALRKQLQLFADQAGRDGIAVALQQACSWLDLDPRQEEFQRFQELANAFGRDLAAFADHLFQNSEATAYDPRAEAVAVMTMHAAKGLEFPVVFLTGLEEGLLPCSVGGGQCDPAEERRLFYVAMTRAREMLCLSAAASRVIHGKPCRQRPSRFLAEIPPRLLTRIEPEQRKPRQAGGQQLRLF